MRTINFTKKDVNVNGIVLPLSRILLIRLIDDSKNSKIDAMVKILVQNKTITLFSGATYKPLNEFSEQEIDNKIMQLI